MEKWLCIEKLKYHDILSSLIRRIAERKYITENTSSSQKDKIMQQNEFF